MHIYLFQSPGANSDELMMLFAQEFDEYIESAHADPVLPMNLSLLYKVCHNMHHPSYQQQQQHRAVCWIWLMYLTQKGNVMQNITLHANPTVMWRTKFRRRGNQHLFISTQIVALVKNPYDVYIPMLCKIHTQQK